MKSLPENMIELLQNAIMNANESWIEKYGRVDSGTCGFASVRLYFGRKRKLKNAIEKSHPILLGSSYKDWSGTYFHIQPALLLTSEQRQELCPTQNIDYYEHIANAVKHELMNHLDSNEYEKIFVESRVD